MEFYSLNSPAIKADFKQACIQGQASDKGLFFPSFIPKWTKEFVTGMHSSSKEAIALEIMKPFVGNTMPIAKLEEIIAHTLAFDIPLHQLDASTSILELFHGPTLAFKDVGARFMSSCLGYFLEDEKDKKVIVLAATSGDTGGAVANGFYETPGVKVVVLYPKGKVSKVQERQICVNGSNIFPLEVDGNFDDCQQMVKTAFVDKELQEALFLTSANSINVARWLPQQLYYALAYKQWNDVSNPPVIAVPSGNFGNICAGLLAWSSGLPVKHFIAATNENKVVVDYLNTHQYQPKQGVATISNAMDVGDPSNFVRVMALFEEQFQALKQQVTTYSISDEETKKTIAKVHASFDYIMDPHTAVAYAALDQYKRTNHSNDAGIVLSTAHPVKFKPTIESVLGKGFLAKEEANILQQPYKPAMNIHNNFDDLKQFLLTI